MHSSESASSNRDDRARRCAAAGVEAVPLGDAELLAHPEQNGARNGGVFSRAGVLQKHFRRDELLGAVVAAGLQVDGIVRSCPFLDLVACVPYGRCRSQQKVCPNAGKGGVSVVDGGKIREVFDTC